MKNFMANKLLNIKQEEYPLKNQKPWQKLEVGSPGACLHALHEWNAHPHKHLPFLYTIFTHTFMNPPPFTMFIVDIL